MDWRWRCRHSGTGSLLGALAGGYRQSAAVSGRALSQRPGLAARRVTDPAGLAVWRQYGRQPGMIRNVSAPLFAGFVLLTCLLTGPARGIVGGAALALLVGYGLRWRWPHAGRLWHIGWLLSFPVILIVLGGMEDTGLSPVATTQWGGLMLTLLLAAVGIVASFPLGLVLALGVRAHCP